MTLLESLLENILETLGVIWNFGGNLESHWLPGMNLWRLACSHLYRISVDC